MIADVYYESKCAGWTRLFKCMVDDDSNVYNRFGTSLSFDIIFNRYLTITDGTHTHKLDIAPAKQKIIIDLLRNPDNLDRYKIKLYIVNQSTLYMRVYISEQYITNLFTHYQVAPRFIETLILNSFATANERTYLTDNIPLYKNIKMPDEPYLKYLSMPLYTHQKNNVHWMSQVEHKTDLNLHYIEYAVTTDLYKFNYGNMKIYMDPHSSILYNEDSLWKYKDRVKREVFKGGVLCDQVGLGKTLSMTTLILANPQHKTSVSATPKVKITLKKKSTTSQEQSPPIPLPVVPVPVPTQIQPNLQPQPPEGLVSSKATLIYCPRRLVGQWISEIAKYVGPRSPLRVIEMSTMVHINKYSMNALCKDVDVVITSFSLLSNKNYRDQTTIDLTKIYWHRVIVDEGHEVLVHDVKRMDDVRTNTEIMNTKGRYKWVCTGTPLSEEFNSMQGIISFLTDRDIKQTSDMLPNLSDEQFADFQTEIFHRNTEESCGNEFTIPKVIEFVDFMSFTETEKALYETAKLAEDTTKMMQLCTNIMISDDVSRIIGNKVLSLDQVNSAMSTYYKEQVETARDRLVQLQLDFDQVRDQQDREISQMEKHIKDMTPQFTKDELDEAKKNLASRKNHYRNRIHTISDNIGKCESEIKYNQRQIAVFLSLNIKNIVTQKCPITGRVFNDIAITPSGHCYSKEGIEMLFRDRKTIYCPLTREVLARNELTLVSYSARDDVEDNNRNRWGTKMSHLILSLNEIFAQNAENRVIIFSQWNKMLDLIGDVLSQSKIEFVFCRGNVHMMSKSIQRFKTDNTIKVILLCSESCSSGSNLTEATHVFLMDTMNADVEAAKATEEQAIARAVRLGQKNNVIVKRFIMKDTIEEEYYRKTALCSG